MGNKEGGGSERNAPVWKIKRLKPTGTRALRIGSWGLAVFSVDRKQKPVALSSKGRLLGWSVGSKSVQGSG